MNNRHLTLMKNTLKTDMYKNRHLIYRIVNLQGYTLLTLEQSVLSLEKSLEGRGAI